VIAENVTICVFSANITLTGMAHMKIV